MKKKIRNKMYILRHPVLSNKGRWRLESTLCRIYTKARIKSNIRDAKAEVFYERTAL